MSRARAISAAGAGFALALVAVLGVASSASAHDQLVSSTPADGETVATLDAVALTYSAALLGTGDESANLVQVTGPDGLHYETACASAADTAVSVPVALGAAGEYTVAWRVVSSDGHPVSGDYAFTYAPEAGTDAAAGAADSPCAALAADGSGAADDGTAAGLAIGLGVGAAALGVLSLVAVIAVVARRRADSSQG